MCQNVRFSTKFDFLVVPDFLSTPFLSCYGIYISIEAIKYSTIKAVTSQEMGTVARYCVDLKNSPSSRMGHPREKQTADLEQSAMRNQLPY